MREYTPAAVARHLRHPSGRSRARRRAGSAKRRPSLSLYCQGLNQSSSGTAKNAALINLHLATGPDRPARRRAVLADRASRTRWAAAKSAAWRPCCRRIATSRTPSIARKSRRCGASTTCPRSRARPRSSCSTRSLPATSRWSGSPARIPRSRCRTRRRVRAGLARAELVVLQEAYTDTETAAFADVLLPATTWGEKEGTVTNSERRISRVRAAVPAPGEARADWSIAVDFARRLEARLQPAYLARTPTLFPYASPEEIFRRACRDDRAAAISTSPVFRYALLDARGPQQWPFPAGADDGHGSASTPTACSRRPTAARASPRCRTCRSRRSRDARYPFRLNTGRLRDQWHGMSRTGTVAQLFQHAGEPRSAAASRPILRGAGSPPATSSASSRSAARIVVPVEASAELKPGHAFLPMHWGSASLGGRRRARRQRADHAGPLPDIAAAGVEARGGTRDEGRAAVAARGVRLRVGRRRAGAARTRCARCSSRSRSPASR